jgi:hypothetical protein
VCAITETNSVRLVLQDRTLGIQNRALDPHLAVTHRLPISVMVLTEQRPLDGMRVGVSVHLSDMSRAPRERKGCLPRQVSPHILPCV